MVLTPEAISAQLWGGPGATSFHASAAALTEMATKLAAIMDGQQATAGVLSTAWASPTGESAIAANAPYQAWMTQAAAQMGVAATQISMAGLAFDAAQALTPTPGEFAQNNVEYAWLTATNLLGQNWPFIFVNRLQYAEYSIRAWTAMGFYTAESAGTVGTIQPLAPPPFSATLAPSNPSIAAGLAGSQSIRALTAGGPTPMIPAAPPVGAALQPVGALTSVLSQPGNLLSQPANALMSSGGELAQAPSAMTSGLAGLGSQTAGAGGTGGAGADGGSWIGATSAAGGTVAASLSGGGAGLSGIGGAVPAAMRGPVSWSSTTNAANPTPNPDGDGVVVSRVAEARAASAAPATSAGMGAPGATMPPAQQASGPVRERERDGTLAATAVLYRPPTEMPVVTGAAGARFVAGEED